MAQSSHVNRNRAQGLYIHELGLFGPFLGKIPIGSISFGFGQKSQFWFTSRARIICKIHVAC